MRKPRILPSLPGLPGSSLPVIVLSFPAAWRSPGAGMAESGLLHPRHPPRVSGEAEAQECPVHPHVARQQPAPGTGELSTAGMLRPLGSPSLASSSSSLPNSKLSTKLGGKPFTLEAEEQRPRSFSSHCPLLEPSWPWPGGSCPLRGRQARVTQHWLCPRC